MSLLKRLCNLAGAIALSMSASSSSDTTQRDQDELKRAASELIASAAATAYDTEAGLVEVRLGDRRLVLPDCGEAFLVSFPFNDRATAQLDCSEPAWRAFVQIRLTAGTPIFVFQRALPAGHTLMRGDVKRAYLSTEAVPTEVVKMLEDVLDKPLLTAVITGEPVRDHHFGARPQIANAAVQGQVQYGWVATVLIPRGNRLSVKSFHKELMEGRIPTDLIPMEVDFELLETTRNIMPGEILRQSTVKLAPAVRKGQELPITIIRGALKVTNTVRMMQDAAVGDAIDAINIESGRNLRVRVVGIGQVELM